MAKSDVVVVIAVLDAVCRCLREHGPTSIDAFHGDEDTVIKVLVAFFAAYLQLDVIPSKVALASALQSVYKVSSGQATTAAAGIRCCLKYIKNKLKNCSSGKFLPTHIKMLKPYLDARSSLPSLAQASAPGPRGLKRHDSLDSNRSDVSLSFFVKESRRMRARKQIKDLYKSSAVMQQTPEPDVVVVEDDELSDATMFVPEGNTGPAFMPRLKTAGSQTPQLLKPAFSPRPSPSPKSIKLF
jgi:hypothetical protein